MFDLRNSTSCMFISRCDSIVFHMSSLMYRYWLLFMYLRLSVLHLASRLTHYSVWVTLVTKLSIPQQEADSRSAKLLSDQKVYITRCILIVGRICPKQCSESDIALSLLNTQLRRFYCLVIHRRYLLSVLTKPQFLHKLIGPL